MSLHLDRRALQNIETTIEKSMNSIRVIMFIFTPLVQVLNEYKDLQRGKRFKRNRFYGDKPMS
ncbi:hypothetical protein IGI82_000067 [Enterococcus sp. AZ067]|nr:hypothetical protein [Enterococcus sp.]